MQCVVFSGDDINRDHIGEHSVGADEAEQIVRNADGPFPQTIEDDKLVVWGQTIAGRYLQVIYVLKPPSEVPYESLAVEDWMAVEAGEIAAVIRVIHAMDLTAAMKKQLRKRRR